MSLYNFLSAVVLFTAVSTTLGQVCPPALDMAPCLCFEDTVSIKCNDLPFPFDIKSVFDRVGPLIDDSVVFNSLEISNTIITELPAGTVESLKFRSISIWYNKELVSISPDAFNASTEVTTELYLGSNYLLSNSTNQSRDLFAFVRQFKQLENIRIGTQLTAIPDDAFGPLEKLTKINFASNPISSIGSRAFSQLSSLSTVEMDFNDISAEGVAVDAFEGFTPNATIDLEDNREMKYLPENSFKILLDTAKTVSVGGAHCNRNGCTFLYLDCDERANWLCQDVEKYQAKLSGFRCSGPDYEYVWDYCAAL
jgi:hypothetical protein